MRIWLCDVIYCPREYLVTIVDFCLTCASFASGPAEHDVVALSSSDIEEALKLLFLSPPHGPVSRVSEPSSRSCHDQLED
jgi:hypothetical protein